MSDTRTSCKACSGPLLKGLSGAREPMQRVLRMIFGLICWGVILQAPRAASATTVTVDASTVVRTLDPYFHGINYVAFWDGAQGSPGSREALRRAGVQLIRFAGGTPGDWIDWADPYRDGWSTTSTLDLWNYARAIGAKPLFQTNPTTNHFNDPSGAHAAAWVTYCLAHGVDAPLWEVGNEPDNGMPGDFDTPYLQWYFDRFNDQAPAMKAANRNITVMGLAGTNTWFWWGEHSLDMFLSQCGARADAVSLHWYYAPSWPGYDNLRDAAQSWQGIMGYLRTVTSKPIYVTEWNALGLDPGEASMTSGLAVANADVIGAFAKSGVQGHALFGSIHGVTNGWGILAGDSDYRPLDTPAPVYYILPLWSKMGSKVLNVTNPADAGTVLSVWAHKKSDGSIQVMLINKTTAQSVDVRFTGYNPTGRTVTIHELKAAQGGAWDFDVRYNGVLNPNTSTTDLPPASTATAPGAVFTRTLPAYSVTVLDFSSPTHHVANPKQTPVR